MADFSNIKQEINNTIYDNENGGITSKSLRELEINIVDSIDGQKQDVISDLSEIRQNASNAYQKPSTGIPETDLDSQVQQKLNTEGSSIFNSEVEATNTQRSQALANVSNQEAGYDDSTPPIFTGKMGYVVLQPEKQGDATTTFAAQIADKPNTIFEIRDVYDCGGTVETPVSVALPDNCTLKFNGGMLKNCTLSANTPIVVENPSDKQIFSNVDASQRITMSSVKTSWFGNTTSEIKKGLDMLIYSAVEINGDITFDGTTLPLWSVNNYTCKNAKITAPAFETEKEVVHLFVDWLPIELSNMQIILANGFKGVGVAVYSTFDGEFNSHTEYWNSSRNKYGWHDVFLPNVKGEHGSTLFYNREENEYTNKSIGIVIRPGDRLPYDGDFNSMFYNHFHANVGFVTVGFFVNLAEWNEGEPTTYANYYGAQIYDIIAWKCAIGFEQDSNINGTMSINYQCASYTDKVIKLSTPYASNDGNNLGVYNIGIADPNLASSTNLIDNTPRAVYNDDNLSLSFYPISVYFTTKSDSITPAYSLGSQNIYNTLPVIANNIETIIPGTMQGLRSKIPFTAEKALSTIVKSLNDLNLRRNIISEYVSGNVSTYRNLEKNIFMNGDSIISQSAYGSYQFNNKICFLLPRDAEASNVKGILITSIVTYSKCLYNGIEIVKNYRVTYDENNNPTVTKLSTQRNNLVISTMDNYYKLNEGEKAYLTSHGRYVNLINHNLYYDDGSPVLPLSPSIDNITQAPLLSNGTIINGGLKYDIILGTQQKIRMTLPNDIVDVPDNDFNVKITLGSENVKEISIKVSEFSTIKDILEYIKNYFNSNFESKWYATHLSSSSTRIEFIDRGYSGNVSVTGCVLEWGDTSINMTASTSGVLSTYTVRNFTKYSESGTLASRPTITESNLIMRYYATDVHKWITWDGTDWYYDDGTQVS